MIHAANEEHCTFSHVRKKAPKPFALSNRVAVEFVFGFSRAMSLVQSVTLGLIWIAEDVFYAPESADSLRHKISLIVG